MTTLEIFRMMIMVVVTTVRMRAETKIIGILGIMHVFPEAPPRPQIEGAAQDAVLRLPIDLPMVTFRNPSANINGNYYY